MINPHEAMRRAVRLASKGFPAPNPHVGCVIVRDGKTVGEGFHDFAGGPHAEVVALAKAGEQARGATAFVTLEPCNHEGRTGPCSQALIDAGILEVYFAVSDPNPKAGGGAEFLRTAGVLVHEGLMELESRAVAKQFLFSECHRRPLVTLKAGVSLDGRIALPSGESQWITGPNARRAAHRLRAECGAVLVGRRTVELDDPQLTARVAGVKNQPVRVVLDPSGKLDSKYRVFDDSAPTRHVTGEIHLSELMASLFAEGVKGLLVEGGAKTHAHFLKAGLVDEIVLFVAPKLLGDGPAWVTGLGLSALNEAPEFNIDEVRRVGSDLMISLVRRST